MNKEENTLTIETYISWKNKRVALSDFIKETLKEIEDKNKTLDKIIEENIVVRDRLSKAIEYINELIADTKGMLDDMKYQDKEETITRFVEDLEKDIKNYEHLEDILRGEE
jgi:hypothetical protein